MKNIIALMLTCTVIFTSCENNPDTSINTPSVDNSFLEGSWFLSSLNVANGTYTANIIDSENNVVSENVLLDYTIAERNFSTPYEISFDVDNNQINQLGVVNLKYNLDGPTLATLNGVRALPERGITRTSEVLEESGTTTIVNERPNNATFDTAASALLEENFLSAFANIVDQNALINFQLVDENTFELSYNAITFNKASNTSEITPSTLTVEVIFSSEDVLRLSYQSSPTTINFGNRVFQENFETGEVVPFKAPFFTTTQRILPLENNYTGNVILEFTRENNAVTFLNENVIPNIEPLLINDVTFELDEDDTNNQIVIDVNRELRAFDLSKVLSNFSLTLNGVDTEISKIIFDEVNKPNQILLDITTPINDGDEVFLNYVSENLIKDGFGLPLLSFEDPAIVRVIQPNFFENTAFDFSANFYDEGDTVNFFFVGGQPAGADSTNTVTSEDVPPGSPRFSRSFKFDRVPAESDGPNTLGFPNGVATPITGIEEGTYRIEFFARTDEPIKLETVFFWNGFFPGSPTAITVPVTINSEVWTRFSTDNFKLLDNPDSANIGSKFTAIRLVVPPGTSPDYTLYINDMKLIKIE